MKFIYGIFLLPLILNFGAQLIGHFFLWLHLIIKREGAKDEFLWPDVSMIIPAKGLDDTVWHNFSTYCNQKYPANYEIIFSVEEEDDPVIPVINDIIKANPNHCIRLILTGSMEVQGQGKTKNLVAAVKESKYNVLVFIDSDVYLSSDYLYEAVPVIMNPENGLAFGLPVREGAKNWVAALSNIGVNAANFLYATNGVLGVSNAAPGPLLITRKPIIEGIIEQPEYYNSISGDDIQMSKAIYKKGYKIRLLRHSARMVNRQMEFKEFWRQVHRWLVVSGKYYGGFRLTAFFMAIPLFWSIFFLIFSVLSGKVFFGTLVIIFVFAESLFFATLTNLILVKDRSAWKFLWVAFLKEIFMVPVFFQSLFFRKIYWRGRWF